MKYRKRLISLLIALSILPLAYNQTSREYDKIVNLIFNYGTIGYNNVKYGGNLDSAEYYLNRAIELAYATPNYEIDYRVAGNHINLASVYRRIYNNGKALHHLTAAENILQKVAPESPLFASLYNNKGNLIKSYYDIYRTREYYEYALDWLIKTGHRNSNDFLEVYSNYIDVLFQMGDTELAVQKLASIDIDKLSLAPDLEFDFQLMKGNGFAMLGRNQEALAHYMKARDLLENTEIAQKVYKEYKCHYLLIKFYIATNDLEKATTEIANGLLFVQSLGTYSEKLEVTYFSTFQYFNAYVLNLQGRHDKALSVIDQITIKIKGFFEEQSIAGLNSKIRNENAFLLPELYTLKSRVLYNIYLTENSLEALKRALESYELSISILNSTKLSMQNESSKIFATSTIIEVYYEAIYIGKLLYEMTDDMAYIEKAFEFTESSKSFALLSEIANMEAIEFSDLPTEVKEKEENLIGKIQGYEGMIYEEQMSLEPDSTQIALYKEKLFHLKDDYDDLVQEIELNNSKYFELKYNPKFISLEALQKKLPYRDAMIEYVLTDTMLITYVIDKKNINVFSQEIGPEFSDECREYYELLNKQNFSSGVRENYRRFVELGRKFYRILIEPCLEFTELKTLTIVPDGAITYLPFEGFLTEDADTEYINYLTLPYMIREFSVGYSQSATLMFSERLKSKPTEKKVLAFAPLYTNPISVTDTAYFRQVSGEEEFLLPLGGIIKEVQSIKETVPSRVFMNERATEANFKKYAPDYNVLHLAMHTIMKDDNPLRSLLAFTTADSPDPSDTIEDNRLYAYEIYNMQLNADMAVLSSCSSGFGKMHKGEGMMSLARGFYYAGCPSIVMTLWQVSDKSSSELMTDFYKYLKKGKSKQEAMRLAKIDYLDESDDLTSNPYFWTGFVVLGDNSPIYRKSGLTYWISIIGLFIGILIFFQYRKR
jgi:CHAT domain-containing protein